MVIAPFTRGDTVSVSFDRVALPTGERFTPLESDLTLILKGPSTLSKEALKEGAFWRLDLKTSDTDTLTAGRYSVYLRIKSSETVKTVAYGTTKVLPKPEDLDETHDPRSRAEKALEEAENALISTIPTAENTAAENATARIRNRTRIEILFLFITSFTSC